jgi:heme o synthase
MTAGKQKIKSYIELTKPKVTLLNLLVGVTCFLLAAYPTIDWVKLAVFSTLGYLVTGGCGVLNSVYDKDIDKQMTRTSKRAIPSGQITSNSALAFGTALVAVSLVGAYLLFNFLTFAMMTLGLIFYIAIYTLWLKRSSPWNVVIGGFAGCFAALAGWTAAVNTLSLLPLLVASLDFLWTPGHLWGLAIKKVKEYRSVHVPMLPVAVGVRKASVIVFWLNFLTVAFSFALPLLGVAGIVYSIVAFGAGLAFIWESQRLLTDASEQAGFKAFVASMPYLMCLMFGLVVDKILLFV